MKILITTDAYEATINGVAVSVKTLSASLKEAGHDVRILTLSQTHQSYQKDGIYHIGSVPLEIYPQTRAAFVLPNDFLDEIIAWQPDIIHSQSEFFTFVFARKLSRILQIPIVHTYHTLYEYYTHYFCPNKKIGQKIVSIGSKYICRHTDAVIAPTKKTADILKNYKIDTPISIIPTGLSLERFQTSSKQMDFCKRKLQLGIPENVPVLITLGRLAREKNIDFLLKQMTAPALRKTHAHLVIVGDGPDRERLESIAHQLHLRDTVHFTGMVTPDEVGNYYRIGDIFVSASQSETQGLTYIEAMASGLPLLCRKDSCLDSVLIEGKNGYTFTSEEEFIENFFRIYQSQVSLNKLSKNAYQTAALFSKEQFVQRVISLYKDVIIAKEAAEKCTRFACILKQI